MTVVKVWGMRWGYDRSGEPRPILVVKRTVRFRWRWVAWCFAVWTSQHWTICTMHSENDRSNVVDLKRVREAGL